MKTFKEITIGELFTLNGNKYKKQSTRTAKPLFGCHINYFYIGLNENVTRCSA